MWLYIKRHKLPCYGSALKQHNEVYQCILWSFMKLQYCVVFASAVACLGPDVAQLNAVIISLNADAD